MQHLIVDKQCFPTPPLIFLFDLMGLAHDYSLNSMVRITQQKWLQPSKERWHFEPKEEHRKGYIFPFLNKLGCIDAIQAKEMTYDYAVILGGYHTRILTRLNFLMSEWQRGLRFRHLIFLTGQRFLDPETEAPLFHFTSKQTESDLMMHVWKNCFPEHPLKTLPFTLVDTPGYTDPQGQWRRPTTKDTLLKWLSYAPKEGKCLFFSSQPFVGYQHTVISTHLPRGFTFETIGAFTEKDLALSIYLDNLSRWLYQENLSRNS